MIRRFLKDIIKNELARRGYLFCRISYLREIQEQLAYQILVSNEYQQKLERAPDYQNLQMQEAIKAGMAGLEPEFLELYEECREYTMTSWERLYALWQAVRYIIANNIPGAFVECGVWRGGSMYLVAKTLLNLGVTNKLLYLYDTFEGMTEPQEIDMDAHGNGAMHDWDEAQKRGVKWGFADIGEVRAIMRRTGYPFQRINFVKGAVQDMLLSHSFSPTAIALLRLDTDWYESTRCELEHLYPLLVAGGVMIVDDYGAYAGARKAVDEYFDGHCLLFHRIDYSCRLVIKQLPGRRKGYVSHHAARELSAVNG